MAETINQTMARIKSLQEFEVQVTVPADFKFTGRVPYDMNIVSDQAFVTVVAESFEQALERARNFFGIKNGWNSLDTNSDSHYNMAMGL